MKFILKSSLLLVTALLILGMGGVGGYPEGTVPETDIRIQVKLMDRAGISSNLNQFSMDGETYLNALRGHGNLTIPFQHIANIIFSERADDEVKIEVKLKSGNTMNLAVKPRAQFYGSTGYGAFQIRAADVAQIQFL